MLQEDLNQVMGEKDSISNCYERDVQLMKQEQESMYAHLNELKEQLAGSQNRAQTQLEQEQAKSLAERRDITEKCEKLSSEMTRKDR